MNTEKQWVLLDPSGTEVAVLDPVIYYEETEDEWIVDNGLACYTVRKSEYPEHSVRFKKKDWVWEDEQ